MTVSTRWPEAAVAGHRPEGPHGPRHLCFIRRAGQLALGNPRRCRWGKVLGLSMRSTLLFGLRNDFGFAG